MSRGFANQHLYLARLLIRAWQRDRDEQIVPARTLDQAYAPGAREHLILAYGYFLNHVLDPTGAASAGQMPRSCDDLPPQTAGKSVPGEIREFRQLEREGWLAQLLVPLPDAAAGSRGARRPDALLAVTSAADWPGPEEAAHWAQQLETIFERMNDSLDEC
ncbi:MAG: DUF6586 family protein [Chromatocurvus sp.]